MKTSAILMTAILTFGSSLSAYDFSHSRSFMKGGQIDPHHYREIHTEALSRLVRLANPSVIIVDARSAKTDDGKRIPSAKAIPFDAPINNITANMPDKEAMIIVYCSNAQCYESGLLIDLLGRMGYENVWQYPEGIEGWEKSGHKVERDKTAAEAATEAGPKSA